MKKIVVLMFFIVLFIFAIIIIYFVHRCISYIPQEVLILRINFVIVIYIILSTTVSVLDLKDAILFLQGPIFPFFFVCVHFHNFLGGKYTLYVCYVFNVI